MRIEQRRWTESGGWSHAAGALPLADAQLVLYFAARSTFGDRTLHDQLRAWYPHAHVLGCSTAGEIGGVEVTDGTLVATAVAFAHTTLRCAYRSLRSAAESRETGEQIARDLPPEGLVHVCVLSEGLLVNGSELVEGLRQGVPDTVAVTGGLAGDGDRFEQTVVWLDDHADDRAVGAIGFYGDRLHVRYGSMGGWDQFGPERLVTRSEGNVLFELDGSPALDLYTKYLGDHARDLPGSGLLFPLSLRAAGGEAGVVRTILGVDEAAGSLTFAGDIPQNTYVRLMKANVDRLIDGANGAAANCGVADGETPELALLVSCVGRKLVLKQRVEEEVESVREVLGASTVLCGFYSYGEIAPFFTSAACELHNQTMTITTFAER